MGPLRLDWRPITTGDAGDVVDLLAASEAVDHTGEHFDEADIFEELDDPNLDVDLDTLAGWAGAELVAFGRTWPTTEVRDVDRVSVQGTVRPSHRRLGIGRGLLEWSAGRAASLHATRHPGVPGEVLVDVFPTNAGQVALMASAGFEAVRRFHVMRHPLDAVASSAATPVPDGLRLEPFDFRYDDATRRARNAAFADHWGSVDRDEITWRKWFTGQRGFRPAVSFLLIEDERADDPVAGFTLSYEFEAEHVVEGVRQVWLGQIGVRPEWRNRGAAKAMMGRALEAYREAGFDRAALDVDTDNASGAPRLYRGTGWKAVHQWVACTRAIPDSVIPPVARL